MARTTAAGMAKALEDEEAANDRPNPNREEELADINARIERIADEALLNHPSLVSDLTQHLVEVFKNRPRPWSQMVESEQRDLVKSLEYASTELVRKSVRIAATEDRPHVLAKVKKLGDDGAKATLTLEVQSPTPDDFKAIHTVMARAVVVILADDSGHMSRGAEIVQTDEKELDFAADTSGGGGNDDDLAGGAGGED